MMKWDIAGVENSQDNHSCYPERDDVSTGNECACWIETREFLSMFWPAKGGMGPEGR